MRLWWLAGAAFFWLPVAQLWGLGLQSFLTPPQRYLCFAFSLPILTGNIRQLCGQQKTSRVRFFQSSYLPFTSTTRLLCTPHYLKFHPTTDSSLGHHRFQSRAQFARQR